jgi:hypothetical protein
MTKLAPIILQTTPSMWHPSELEVEGYAFTKYDLRQPRRGVEGWWVGPSAFRVNDTEWRQRVIIVTQPVPESDTAEGKRLADRRWKAFLAAAAQRAGSLPQIIYGDAFFHLPPL